MYLKALSKDLAIERVVPENSKEIGPHAQDTLTILGSVVNMIGRNFATM